MATNFNINPSFADTPYGLKLQQTITSSGAVTIPSNVKRVFAICIGGGGSGGAGTTAKASATITNVTASAGVVTYTCINTFIADDTVSISGVSPTAYNLNNVRVASASATQFTVTNAATGTYVSGGTANAGNVAGGGGAGAFAMGWTFADNTCTIAAGGAGTSDTTVNGVRGGITRFGGIIAGGGTGGRSCGYFAVNPGILGGAGGGGATVGAGTTSAALGSASFFGWVFGNIASRVGNFAAGGDQTNQVDGVVASGGAGRASAFSGLISGYDGAKGIIAGGGGGTFNRSVGFTAAGGAGGNGDFFNGGTGSTGTSPTGGAGGGGAGYAGAGSNASGTNGGAGGDGGGGGGASTNLGTSGAGGAGVIYLYY